MGQVQVNLRVDPGTLAAIERARGSMPRNAWLLAAVEAALAGRVVNVARPARVVECPSRPVSVRAPRGCRVVGVPRALRELDGTPEAPIPGRIDLEEALAS